jgi:hypothetical protein
VTATQDYAIRKFGPDIANISGEWVVTNICYQQPRQVGVDTVAVGPTTYLEAVGHAVMWNDQAGRDTTWIVRRAVPADSEH